MLGVKATFNGDSPRAQCEMVFMLILSNDENENLPHKDHSNEKCGNTSNKERIKILCLRPASCVSIYLPFEFWESLRSYLLCFQQENH